MDFMKKAYSAVALDCTVKYFASMFQHEWKYLKAIERIWQRRTGNLENLKISNLLIKELIDLRQEIVNVIWDEHVCTRLMTAGAN
ncbi:hypothetical protein SLA2020_145610 [Shorea laevis]